MARVAFPGAPRIAERNRQDINILVHSDSRANATIGFPKQWASLLAAAYPSHTVVRQKWDGAAWGSDVTVATGTGTKTIKIYNGSLGSTSYDYQVANADDINAYPATVDYIVISDNDNAIDDLDDLIDICKANHPDASIVFSFTSPKRLIDVTAGNAAITAICDTYDIPTIDVPTAFDSYGDWETDLMADDVHPNEAGYILWAETIMAAWEASMTITAQARNVADGVLLSWTDTNPDSYTVAVTEYDLTDPDGPSTRTVTFTDPDELQWFDDDIDAATDRVTYLITNSNDANTGTVTIDRSGAYTFGAIDTNETSIRYTTLAAVKKALGVPTAQTDRDDEITDAILAAESWIDDYCGRSFPDTSANPQFDDIPNRVTRAALLLSTSFYTAEMSPDVLDPFEADLRSERASNMAVQLLGGFRATFGVA